MKTKLSLVLIFTLLTVCLCAIDNITGINPTGNYISVALSGYVRYPGTYKVLPVDRLSDVIAQAMLDPDTELESDEEEMTYVVKVTNPIPLLRSDSKMMFPNFEAFQSLRNVLLTRNGVEKSYDLLAYLRTGDIEQNPILRDSDQVHVPLKENIVFVNGSVGFPGEIEYLPGDTIRRALELALGPVPGGMLSALRISKFDPETKSYQHSTVNLETDPSFWDMELQPNDRIMVPFDNNFRKKIAVTVSGEFMLGGEYVITDSTSLWELIQLAGGVSDRADLENAVVLNKPYNQEPDREFERIRSRSMAELTPLEYSYLRIKLRQAKGKYSVDIAKIVATEGRAGDIKLQDGDQIYIPPKMDVIWVSGQVKYPGLITYVEGKDWKYYIEQAGGYTNNRNIFGTRILRGDSGNWLKPSKKLVMRPGDTVFVPDKQDRDLWTDFRDVLSVTASAITIILGIQNLIY